MVRLKTRYIVFEILYPQETNVLNKKEYIMKLHSPSHIDGRNFLNLIKQTIKINFGDNGIGSLASSIALKYFSPATSIGILRVSRKYFRLAQASLTLLYNVCGKDVLIRVIHISGTIKHAERAAIKHSKALVSTLQNV